MHMDFGSLKCCNFGGIRTDWVLADSFFTTKQVFSSHTQEIWVCVSQTRGNSRVPPYIDQFPHQCLWKTLLPPLCPWTPELTVSPYPGSTCESSHRRASSDGTECFSARPVGKEEEFTLRSEWAKALWITTVTFFQEPRHSNRQTREVQRNCVQTKANTKPRALVRDRTLWGSLPVTEVLRALTCTALQSPLLSSGEHEWGAV